jgi:hypothetical protein
VEGLLTQSVAGKVPVIAVWREAWIFLARHWRTFVPAAFATAVISQIGQAATLMLGGGAAPSLGLAVALPMILAGLMFTGAVMRKAVRDEFAAPIGVKLGGDEARLLGVGASVTLLAIPIFLLLMVGLSATVLRSVAPSPEAMEALAADPEAMMQAIIDTLGLGGLTVLTTVLLAMFALATGFVSLANAATTGEKRIMLFQAWSWMRGNVMRVLAVFLLTAAPVIFINSTISEVVITLFFSAAGEAPSLLPYLLVLTLITFVTTLVGIPISAMGAILYKGLRPGDLAAR